MSTFRIITGTQSKAADRYAIDTLKIPSLTLMENASRCVAEEIIRTSDPSASVLLCSGVGNNGADGLCVGRLLYEAGFRNLQAILCGSEEKATWEFRHQLEEYEKLGLPDVWYEETSDIREIMAEPDVLVDGVFGIGLHRPVEGRFLRLLEQMNEAGGRVVAIDIPSGVDSDTGEIMGAAVQADVTITFGCKKTGIAVDPGASKAGRVRIADIDIPEEAYLQAIDAKHHHV